VAAQVILEIKSVETLLSLHQEQQPTYLQSTPCSMGLLLNFNTVSLAGGIERCIL
jgi:GxxExxY protein